MYLSNTRSYFHSLACPSSNCMYCKEESDKSMKCLPLQCAAKKAFNPTAKTCVGKILQLGEIHSNTNTYLPVYK